MISHDNLKTLPFFSGLNKAHLNKILSISREENFKKGHIIFAEGEPCKGMYIVLKGEVKIYKISPEGRELILRMVAEGEPFGGVPIFLENPKNPAFAECEKNTKVLLVPRHDLLGLISKNSEFALKVLSSFAAYLNSLVNLIEDLSLKDVHKRLAKYLLELAEKKGVETKRGTMVELGISKEKLSHRLGTVREVISRAFSQLQSKRIIRMEGKTVLILDREKLAKL